VKKSSSADLKLLADSPSVEEALKVLASAMKALETPDLSKTGIT
jgi:hypothetical protein